MVDVKRKRRRPSRLLFLFTSTILLTFKDNIVFSSSGDFSNPTVVVDTDSSINGFSTNGKTFLVLDVYFGINLWENNNKTTLYFVDHSFTLTKNDIIFFSTVNGNTSTIMMGDITGKSRYKKIIF